MTIDLLPTIARLAGAECRRPDRLIDGRDIWPLMAGEPGANSPHEVLYFYWLGELQAVRSGRWKLHFAHDYPHVVEPGHDGKPGRSEKRRIEPALFDLQADVGETTNVAAATPGRGGPAGAAGRAGPGRPGRYAHRPHRQEHARRAPRRIKGPARRR